MQSRPPRRQRKQHSQAQIKCMRWIRRGTDQWRWIRPARLRNWGGLRSMVQGHGGVDGGILHNSPSLIRHKECTYNNLHVG